MQTLRAEFHVHTVLSPCAELEMLPPLIVLEAIERNIGLIAVTDHNATANIAAVQKAAEGSGLTVLAGMELQTREDVHVLCLFDRLEQAASLQQRVDAALPAMENRPDYFGDQLVVDEHGNFITRENRLLSTSTKLTINQVWRQVERLVGLMIPAHVDRPVNGLIPTLGMIPDDIPFEALEISRHLQPKEAYLKYPQMADYPLVQGGDAHRLEELIGVNQLQVEDLTVAEIRLALAGREGRSLSILNSTN
ncbi:MAG: PHP domain-containing protein [Bellilinea sp.]